MCGIAGILEISPTRRRPDIIAMTDAMSHRGPDSDGFYNDGKVSLGHRRLSIIDLSTSANQPFFDESERYVMVFNGEIYNYMEVKKALPNYHYRTTSDTEVLLAAFLEWGVRCVDRCKGMFSFAVWDKVEKSLFVFRDRLGVKPLYYYVDKEYFLFASEVRAILATGIVKRKLDRDGLPDYLGFQSFAYPSSPIADIKQLEAGCYMKIAGGNVQTSRYWQLGGGERSPKASDPIEVKNEIRELLTRSVSQRLVSDVPVGAFLSGGIDSSAVVALMSSISSVQPSTFNISFNEEGFDESRYAEMVAKKYRTNHQTIRLSDRVLLDELENALDSYDSPSADGVNTYVVSKAIKRAGITVALSGIGGDELFAGYPFFSSYLKAAKYRRIFNATGFLRKGLYSTLGMSSSPRVKRFAALVRSSKFGIDSFYPEFRRILTSEEIARLTKIGSVGDTNLERTLKDRTELFESLPSLSQVSAAEYLGYTQNTLLKDTDQMSMAVSLEVREPFFDHELIDFVLQVPDEIKRPRYPKSLLVEALAPMLPDEIVFRKKQGFLFPWTIWMKNDIRRFCEQRIFDMAERDFINGVELRDYWKRFLEGDSRVNWTALWLFVVLEYWMAKNDVV